MKAIYEYINESLTNKGMNLLCEQISLMFKDSGLLKDNFKIIFSNLDEKIIKGIVDYLSLTDNTNFIAYSPSDDMFINYDNNKETIIEQLSDYFIKYKV